MKQITAVIEVLLPQIKTWLALTCDRRASNHHTLSSGCPFNIIQCNANPFPIHVQEKNGTWLTTCVDKRDTTAAPMTMKSVQILQNNPTMVTGFENQMECL